MAWHMDHADQTPVTGHVDAMVVLRTQVQTCKFAIVKLGSESGVTTMQRLGTVVVAFGLEQFPALDGAALDDGAVHRTDKVSLCERAHTLSQRSREEVIETLHDLRAHDVDVVTIGQYLQPSKKHLPVKQFILLDQFKEYEEIGLELGFRHVESSALVRSSYKAQKHIN